jgi:hypothetical protein
VGDCIPQTPALQSGKPLKLTHMECPPRPLAASMAYLKGIGGISQTLLMVMSRMQVPHHNHLVRCRVQRVTPVETVTLIVQRA